MAKRACLSVDQVVVALDEEEESSDFEEDYDIAEPIMGGSDDEFGEVDNEVHDLIEAEEESGDNDEAEMESACSQEEIELPVTRVNIPFFTSRVGPKLAIPDTVLGAFELYFTPHIHAEMTSQSNLYACQVLGDDNDRYKPIYECERIEGLPRLMDIKHLPAIEDYWKRDKAITHPYLAASHVIDFGSYYDTFTLLIIQLFLLVGTLLMTDWEKFDLSSNTCQHSFRLSTPPIEM